MTRKILILPISVCRESPHIHKERGELFPWYIFWDFKEHTSSYDWAVVDVRARLNCEQKTLFTIPQIQTWGLEGLPMGTNNQESYNAAGKSPSCSRTWTTLWRFACNSTTGLLVQLPQEELQVTAIEVRMHKGTDFWSLWHISSTQQQSNSIFQKEKKIILLLLSTGISILLSLPTRIAEQKTLSI